MSYQFYWLMLREVLRILKAGVRMGFDEKLADIAETFVSASPSSAFLERHFSTLGFTYNNNLFHLKNFTSKKTIQKLNAFQGRPYNSHTKQI